MRTETRLVLGWLIGRPDNWTVYVGHVQRTLGLTERRWVTVRKELEAMGYLKQIRRQNEEGKFVWEHIVYDTPMTDEPETREGLDSGETTIPLKPQDGSKGGKTIPPKTMDGLSMHGECGDITTPPNQHNLNTPSPYPLPEPPRITLACVEEARERFQGYSIETLEVEWRRAITEKGEHPRNPDRAFLGWASAYARNHPLPYGGGF